MLSFSSFQVYSSEAISSWELSLESREAATSQNVEARLAQSMAPQIEEDSIPSLLIKMLVCTEGNIHCFCLKENWLECWMENDSEAEFHERSLVIN